MALDKVVDSAALDAGMTAVAGAIRAKAGTTDPLAWPDGFAAAISGIETGGGGKYQAGTLIGDGTSNAVIPLEFEPDFLYIQLTDTDTTLDANHTVFGTIVRDYCYAALMRAANATNAVNGGSGFQISGLYGSSQNNATYESGVLTWRLKPSGRNFYNGASYTWVARKW